MEKGTIMCIDDERIVLDTLERQLEKYRDTYNLEFCSSAVEALEVRDDLLSEGRRVDIYIVDQRMPEVTGIDFLKGIDKDSGKILLTAYADTQVAIEGIKYKCIDFYMMKPWREEEIHKNIDTLVYALEKGIFVTQARTPEERQEALKIQNTVFSEEHLELPYEKGIEIIGQNPYEDKTRIYVAVYQRNVVGTTSLSKPDKEFAGQFGTILGLPIEEFYDISTLIKLDPNLAQVRNATVVAELQHNRVAPMIWGQIYRDLMSEEPRSEYVTIIGASLIRNPKKAKSLYEKIKQDTLLDEEKFIPLKEENDLGYDGKISQEDIDNTVYSRQLKTFMKMGFRFIGEPIYYQNFNMYDFPMMLKVEDTAQPFKTWFETGRL